MKTQFEVDLNDVTDSIKAIDFFEKYRLSSLSYRQILELYRHMTVHNQRNQYDAFVGLIHVEVSSRESRNHDASSLRATWFSVIFGGVSALAAILALFSSNNSKDHVIEVQRSNMEIQKELRSIESKLQRTFSN